MSMHAIERLPTVDSTNAEAMRRAMAGERGPLWIVADEQTAGRGRAGRSWSSQRGNLQASLLLTFAAPAAKAYQLALVTGVATFDAIGTAMGTTPKGLRLKWPNDIMIDGAKAGGILIESSTLVSKGTEPGGLAAVIGIGMNVASAPHVPDRPTTYLSACGEAPEPEALLAALADSTAHWLAVWDEGRGFAAVREAWLNRAHPIGERMSINTGSERVSGAFVGLDADGALILQTEGETRRFTFGDVSFD